MHQVQLGEVVGDSALQQFDNVGDTCLLNGIALHSERRGLALIIETFDDL